MQTFAEQLNAVRKEHHITQEQLAQELNVSRTTISRWESGVSQT
ncbi:MAG: helix-turn-helix transcriptional regulator [Clostridia bacterium]|nr:helix-turn-helix transcriptional regulator [Clostridia bacterium]